MCRIHKSVFCWDMSSILRHLYGGCTCIEEVTVTSEQTCMVLAMQKKTAMFNHNIKCGLTLHDCQNCGGTDLQSYQNVVLLIVLKSLKTMKLG